MPITSQATTTHEDGQDKDCITVTFTNGAKQQIEELQKFVGASDPLDVIKLGISFIQRAKEMEEKKKEEDVSNSHS